MEEKNKFYTRRKYCRFCKMEGLSIDYKDAKTLLQFLSARGKILPRRMTGCCSKHQRALSRAIKRARVMALIPYIVQEE